MAFLSALYFVTLVPSCTEPRTLAEITLLFFLTLLVLVLFLFC